MNTWQRCLGSEENLNRAVEIVGDALETTGIELNVRKVLVESEAHARELRFESSPTIRVNGQDIASRLMQNKCDDCGEMCGCDEETDCRIWEYQGNEHTAAPVGLVVESILHSAFAGTKTGRANVFEDVPENLKRFFKGKTLKQEATQETCYSPEQQESYCEPE